MQTLSPRYASAGVGLFLTIMVGTIALVASYKVQGVKTQPAYILVTISTLMVNQTDLRRYSTSPSISIQSTVAIYRLVAMQNSTDSLLSRGPGSLSSPAAKALFYIFHMLPEWTASVILLGLNARVIFETGPFGDWRSSDKETKWEKKKREKREREEAKGSL